MKALSVLVGGSLLCATAGCGGFSDEGHVSLEVFAASSLTEALTAVARSFEATHPGIDVRLHFAGSQTLRLQIEHGAEADVFVSAHEAHIESLERSGAVAERETFAENPLALIVPLESTMESFAELATVERLVIGNPNAPIGQYTRELLDRIEATLGTDFAETVRGRVVSEESNVRLVRAKVALGEVDAGVVYRSDVVSAPDVREIRIPDEINVRGRYWIATTVESEHLPAARLFVDFVKGSSDEILVAHGLTPIAR